MRVLSLSVLAALATAGYGQTTPKNMTFSTALKSVAVFRDGFGYYVREGKVKLENGWATTDLVPQAIKGTVRFYTLDKNDKIDQVVIGKENRLDFASPAEIKARLADKVGLKLTVITRSGQRYEGQLAKILDDMLLLRVGDAFTGVPYDSIQTILLTGFPVRIKVTTDSPNKVVGIGVAYLQEGIRWEPSYVLDVHGDTGSLALRASMQNTTEALKDSDVFFVVGSPFVANRGITDMLAPMPVAPPADKDTKPENPVRRAEVEAEEAKRGNVESAAVTREEAGELYYYHKPGLSLANNDVAMISVFEAVVPVSPRFEWNADGEEVSYLVSIQNKSSQPLTTGPVFVLEDGKAIGQENVKYTPANGTAEIRLSRGIGLKVAKTEAEVRRGAPAHVGKTDYIPVFLKGTLTITNYKTTKATVRVTKTARGKVNELSDGGVVKQTQILNGEPNPINDLEWKVDVAPGATKTITYTFETYMSAERAGSPPIPSGNGDVDRG
ncbi:DUF4139 domain-containing protein [Fimbriimonas ginsengisoli]|nr:DUF4139 domain-containing protein [Fimbriimonas ginsengisoli]